MNRGRREAIPICGICGIVDYAGPPIETAVVGAMTAALRHRGPDDSGTAALGPAHLGHTRLTILDLTQAGHQPMQTDDGRFTIVYNGETYNFQALRSELAAEGVRFHGRSDTEVVLQAYRRWETDAFARLNGMFAMAIWDANTRILHLARDRFGIKPLYYSLLPSGIVFGSEIKAILASGSIEPEIDWAALHEYLYYGNPLGSHTLFRDITRLLPGHYLRLAAGGATTAAYWSVEQVAPVTDGVAAATAAVREHVESAVARHLVSDVPVGVFLSGGLDSTSITAVARRHYPGDLHTFSAGFDFDRGVNELPTARRVARTFGTQHHEVRIAGAELPSVIERLVTCHDEPFGDPANLPLYLLCEQLRGTIKVVLQGDGGDEMFAGYRRYNIASMERIWRWAARAGLIGSIVAPRGPTAQRASRFFRAMTHPDPAIRVALLLTWETLQEPPTRVLSGDARAAIQRYDPFARYREVGGRLAHLDPVQRMLYTDAMILLPNTFLEKVDRPTMAHGIEVRVPFLDAELASYAMGLPSGLKIRGATKKWILRRALRGIVPQPTLQGRKHGFGVPVDYWMRGPLESYLRSVLLDGSTLASGLFDRKGLERVMQGHVEHRRNDGPLLYKVLQLALWWRRYAGPERTPHLRAQRTYSAVLPESL